MTADGKKARPEREQTDESLRTERARSDRALAARQAAVESEADLVVRRARETADAVLSVARDRADEAAPPRAPQATLVEERAIADEAIKEERACADESLQHQRDESERVLYRLLPLERNQTDRYLLTERTRSDDALANRDDFLGIVSHDLRNLLGGIVMSAALVSKRSSEDERGRQTLAEMDRIQRYAARMNRLIGDLVDVASIDAGKLAVTPARGDVIALIEEAVDTFQGAAAASGVSLQAEPADRPLLAMFDHDRVLQVLANLITNALKFSAAGGRIRLRAERVREELQVTVSDSGAGIAASKLEVVFERFWQARKDDRRGVGLGLHISRCIVEAHGGRIWAESTLGEGSHFRFTLPAVTP